ncbi:MAG: serine hydrolase, partial [Clostridia bacterium]|nr:serine hydrolase [Clostridia bacterium]
DNTATNLLIDRLGIENINQTLISYGLDEIILRRKLFDAKSAARGIQNRAISTQHHGTFRLAVNILGSDIFKLLAAFVHTENLVLVHGRDQNTRTKLDQFIRYGQRGIRLIVNIKIGDQSKAFHMFTFLPKRFCLSKHPSQDPLPPAQNVPDTLCFRPHP